jgi:hypothetical protein
MLHKGSKKLGFDITTSPCGLGISWGASKLNNKGLVAANAMSGESDSNRRSYGTLCNTFLATSLLVSPTAAIVSTQKARFFPFMCRHFLCFLYATTSNKTHILMRRHRPYTLTVRRLPHSSTFQLLVLLFFLWDSLHAVSLYLYQRAATDAPAPPSNTRRIYIAAQHWNTARILRSHWNAALEALVQELGIDNVFVSIYESGSFDDTKGALRELDSTLERLQVKRSIMLSDLSHADQITRQPADQGWIKTPAGQTELRRIPFLASIRNEVLKPLEVAKAHGERFDTILFLNDVVFTTEDVLRLLDTNDGEYAAACSLDFSKPPAFYDTFALRDSNGHEAVMKTWPYFQSHLSRYAMERALPVPVTSCWNGMGTQPPILLCPEGDS